VTAGGRLGFLAREAADVVDRRLAGRAALVDVYRRDVARDARAFEQLASPWRSGREQQSRRSSRRWLASGGGHQAR
jgi:hypothetical protein